MEHPYSWFESVLVHLSGVPENDLRAPVMSSRLVPGSSCFSEARPLAGWTGQQPGLKLAAVPVVAYPKAPDMSTSTSWMWLLQLEAVTVGLPEGSLPRTRLTEIVTPLTHRSKEPCSLLDKKREASMGS